MPVVVVMMIEIFFSFVRKGRDRRRKKERLCVFLRLSFSHGAAAAITSSNNRPLHTPKTRVARRTSTRATYCKLLPIVPKQQLEFK
jgi:hypothetical protein